ncbi:DUF5667 domain-containing protein [Streptomyces himalayensis]|uniref:DUF5667 domain-containing protein n=1 Tax=Streptomyces himalayensis subsp. himalayensis TaxID=2756131 RepID=A0A7W0IDN6_9ACTN|nr:DUF5667 domain-containing protein [Streptomyces himalayensis]MBA2952010.1 hypothetical protein [Streptomyces himalayensis subsp. himalayensis]
MIANVSAHRRANAFAQALEEHSDRVTAAEKPGESAEQAEKQRMLALATGLGGMPKPELDAGVKVVQRARLVAAMEAMVLEGTEAGSEGAGPSVPEQRSRRGAHRASPLRKLRSRSRLSKGIAAGGLTVGVAAGALGGVAAASTDALPGDSLYGLKRGMEDLKLGMADGESDRGRLYLDQAATRLNEARRLMERGRSGDLDHESVSEMRRALSGVQHDASAGHRLLHSAYERDGSLGPIQALSSFSQSNRDTWTTLRERLPVQLGDVSQEVSSVFDAIDQEVDPLRSMLPGSPSSGDGTTQPGTGQESTGSSGSDRPSPTTSGSSAGSTSGTGSPEPSTSGASEDEGLLGGNTGGLFDPPVEETSPSPSGEASLSPEPDITVPPLLPFLPGLGIGGEDT